jgi:hypothetical protein
MLMSTERNEATWRSRPARIAFERIFGIHLRRPTTIEKRWPSVAATYMLASAMPTTGISSASRSSRRPPS